MKRRALSIVFSLCAAWLMAYLTPSKACGAEPATNDSATSAESEGEKDQAAAEEDRPSFMRLRRDDDDQPLSLDTPIVTYESAGEKHRGVTVELVGAVHVGDADYYEALNKEFEQYDVLLYELVAPEKARIPKGGRKQGGGLINMMQGGMKSLLELEHQLEKIDYTKKNFVHADMSPKEFAKSMEERGESFLQMFLRAMGQSAAMQASGKQPISDADIILAMFAKDRPLRLKRLLARQFEDVEGQIDIFQGPDGSTIITERNKKCFEVLKKELAKGHKKIGVFYGAGHLSDMEDRLLADFGMKRTGERWLTAWDLRKKTADGEAAEESKPKSTEAEEPPAKEPEVDDRDPFDESPSPRRKAG